MHNAERYPFLPIDSALGEAGLQPRLPLTLAYQDQSVAVTGLLDTGAMVNVLPYPVGVDLGAVWEQQTTVLRLTGNLAQFEARALLVSAAVGSFAPVRLVFAWTQALIYVTDVPEERGPFRGVSGVYAALEAWLAERPEAVPFHDTDFSHEPATSVPGKAGDLIIWHPRLPHGPGRNVSQLPRVMQPISMFPAPASDLVEVGGGRWTRQEQIAWWWEKRPPPWWRGLKLDPRP